MAFYDQDGQPINRNYNARLVADRTLDEMLGLCKGVLADGVVNEIEADYLHRWMQGNSSVAQDWPASVLAERLNKIFADGKVDDNEREDLKELLQAVTGEITEAEAGAGAASAASAARKATRLPLDNPPPVIKVPGSIFCFTGKFCYGTRRSCERAVTELGGSCHPRPKRGTDYLVVGILASRDWLHTTHGTKIETAMMMRERMGRPIIVDEEHWVNAIGY